LPNAGRAQVEIINALGETVEAFVSDTGSSLSFDVNGLSNGIYFARISSEGFVDVRKFVVSR